MYTVSSGHIIVKTTLFFRIIYSHYLRTIYSKKLVEHNELFKTSRENVTTEKTCGAYAGSTLRVEINSDRVANHSRPVRPNSQIEF